MPVHIDLAGVTLGILSGGQSRRMGVPKPSLQIQGRPILQYLLESLRWPGPTLLITAPSGRRPPGCESFDREASDLVEGEGPLRGVLTALEECRTDYLLIATVDMPAIKCAILQWIAQRLVDHPDLEGIMLRRVIDGKERIEPFPLACRVSAARIISAHLREGKRSIHSLVDLPAFDALAAPGDWPSQTWTNLNSPEDYQAFLRSNVIL